MWFSRSFVFFSFLIVSFIHSFVRSGSACSFYSRPREPAFFHLFIGVRPPCYRLLSTVSPPCPSNPTTNPRISPPPHKRNKSYGTNTATGHDPGGPGYCYRCAGTYSVFGAETEVVRGGEFCDPPRLKAGHSGWRVGKYGVWFEGLKQL